MIFCEGNPPVTGGFPSQRSVKRSFDIFFDVTEQTTELTIQVPVIWYAMPLIVTSM